MSQEMAVQRMEQVFVELGMDNKTLASPELDLEHTPHRVVKMWLELTAGLRTPAPAITLFESEHDQMVILRDVEFTSLCSHHLAPFMGRAHIAYVPGSHIVGISKLARVVDWCAARPQTQEKLTNDVVAILVEKLKPKGLMVVMAAKHACIGTRGAKKPESEFVTSVVYGCLADDPSAKAEALRLLHQTA